MRDNKRGTIEDRSTDRPMSKTVGEGMTSNRILTVGNLRSRPAALMLQALGIQFATCKDSIGIYEGEIENSVEVTLYAISWIDTQALLYAIGRRMPKERQFGVDGELFDNPHFQPNKTEVPL